MANVESGQVVPQKEVVKNVLADRYASPEMVSIFSDTTKVVLERNLWIAVMKAQSALGVAIPPEAIERYEAVKDNVDSDSIRAREEITKHDVKARIEEFNALAGGDEYIHKAMTSRDLTDNVEQMQIRLGMSLIRDKSVAVLSRFRSRSLEHAAIMMAARSHNVPAQPTLLGKRFTMWGEEMLEAFQTLEDTIEDYPLRGIKGPVGTQVDQLQLLKDQQKVFQLEERVAEHLGFKRRLGSVGQIYPRSFDFMVISSLYQISTAPANLSNMIRLMAGHDQIDEGFSEGQSGSSAMPHKVNTRTCERIKGINTVLKGYVTMMADIAGDQWNEGDVRDSVPRRVAIPDAFYALDGQLEATLHVLDELNVYPAVIKREIDRYMPFLTSTRILTAAQERGVGRETAHKIVKKHSLEAARQMKVNGVQENVLYDSLSADSSLGLSKEDIVSAAQVEASELVGNADQQVIDFAAKVDAVLAKYPNAAQYNPYPLL